MDSEKPLGADCGGSTGERRGPVDISFVYATDQASRDIRNGSDLLMLSRPIRRKKILKGFSTKKAVIRVSSLVIREKHKSRVSSLVIREKP